VPHARATNIDGEPDGERTLSGQADAALVHRHRAAEIDAAYAAYETTPLEKPDAWGDLASFREAARAS
jgi:surface antigen